MTTATGPLVIRLTIEAHLCQIYFQIVSNFQNQPSNGGDSGSAMIERFIFVFAALAVSVTSVASVAVATLKDLKIQLCFN